MAELGYSHVQALNDYRRAETAAGSFRVFLDTKNCYLFVRAQTFGEDHRVIEICLDELLSAIRSGSLEAVDRFRDAHKAVTRHYRREDPFFEQLRPGFPDLCSKMLAQHAEVLEVAVQAETSLEMGQMADALTLMRRFHSIAQHNIIEEERDVFPLLAKRGGGPPLVK
jgi:hypothetical protein